MKFVCVTLRVHSFLYQGRLASVRLSVIAPSRRRTHPSDNTQTVKLLLLRLIAEFSHRKLNAPKMLHSPWPNEPATLWPERIYPHLRSRTGMSNRERTLSPLSPPQTLSVAIITKNEEDNLARTLASVQFADEIIVLDSASTDRTVEIARSFNAKVYDEPWQGFSGSKNSAIAKCTGTWILSLDADEELSPKLQHQIRMLLPTNPPVGRLLHPPPQSFPGPLDQARRFLSRSQAAALPAHRRQLHHAAAV